MSLFLQSATGDPTRNQRRIGRQSSVNVPAADTLMRDFRQNGGPFLLDQAQIPRAVLAKGGAPQPKLTGKWNIGNGPLVIGDVDCSNLAFLLELSNSIGYYDYVDNTTWQSFMFHPGGATTSDGYLTMWNDNDINPRTRFIDGLCGGFTIGATPNGNFAAQFPMLFGGFDFFAAATQTAGTSSTQPHIRNSWSGNWIADATDDDLYVKFISSATVSGVTTWTLKAKIGAAASYSGSFTAVVGLDSAGNAIYTRVVDDTGAAVGTWAEQVLIHLPAGGTYTANDIWKWAKRRDRWTQSMDPEKPISSVETVVYVDPGAAGSPEEVRIDGGFQTNAAWSIFGSKPYVSGRQGARVDRGGDLNVTWTPTRRIADPRFQKAIFSQQNCAVIVDSKTSVNISGATRPYRFLQIYPAMKFGGPLFDTAAGGQNRDEAPVGTAGLPTASYTYDGYTVPVTSHCAFIVESDITTSEW